MIRILSRDLTVKFSISVQTLVIALCSCVLGVTAAIVTVVMDNGFSFLLFCLLYVRNISKKHRHALVDNPCCFTFSTHHSHLLWLNHCGLVVSRVFNHRFEYLPVQLSLSGFTSMACLLHLTQCCVSLSPFVRICLLFSCQDSPPFSFCQELKYSFVKDTGKRYQNFGGVWGLL